MYNKEKLLEDINMVELCGYMGIPVRVNSSTNIDILCPGHNDTHFGSCKIRNKGCYCFVCGKYIDVFEMVKLKLGLDFKEAFSYLGDSVGKESDYKSYNHIALKKRKAFPLSKEEMKILKLSRTYDVKMVVGFSDVRPEYQKGYTYEVDYDNEDDFLYVIEKVFTYSLDDLLKEDPEYFRFLLATKIKCLADKISASRHLFSLNTWKKEIDVANHIIKKFNLSECLCELKNA